MTAPLVLVTRPEPDGPAFLDRLRRAAPREWRGLSAPLGRIVPVAFEPPPGADLVLTSRNAVRALGRAGAGRAAWCVGRATARAARLAGMVPEGPDVDGDADALVARIAAARPRGPLVHLRGREARGDVAARLRALGVEASEAVVYEQRDLGPTAEAEALLGAGGRVVAPVFSPRGAARLAAVLPPGRAVDAVAVSPAAARALGPAGEGATVAAAPSAAAMVEAVAGRLARPA